MYKLKVNNTEYTIPKENIVLLAMQQAMDRGIMQGNIHDEQSAIEYLESIGIEVSDVLE